MEAYPKHCCHSRLSSTNHAKHFVALRAEGRAKMTLVAKIERCRNEKTGRGTYTVHPEHRGRSWCSIPRTRSRL